MNITTRKTDETSAHRYVHSVSIDGEVVGTFRWIDTEYVFFTKDGLRIHCKKLRCHYVKDIPEVAKELSGLTIKTQEAVDRIKNQLSISVATDEPPMSDAEAMFSINVHRTPKQQVVYNGERIGYIVENNHSYFNICGLDNKVLDGYTWVHPDDVEEFAIDAIFYDRFPTGDTLAEQQKVNADRIAFQKYRHNLDQHLKGILSSWCALQEHASKKTVDLDSFQHPSELEPTEAERLFWAVPSMIMQAGAKVADVDPTVLRNLRDSIGKLVMETLQTKPLSGPAFDDYECWTKELWESPKELWESPKED